VDRGENRIAAITAQLPLRADDHSSETSTTTGLILSADGALVTIILVMDITDSLNRQQGGY